MSSFGIEGYLKQRDSASPFTMVEIGHGPEPVVYKQLGFTGSRSYIGIEAGLRDVYKTLPERLEKLQADSPAQNAEFIFHDLGGEIVYERDDDGIELHSWYEGKYEPTTSLPDSIADEVFLGNVLGDDHNADIPANGQALLREVSRIVKDEGIVIVRESITPNRVVFTKQFMATSGLGKICKLRGDDYDHLDTWAALEQRYNAGRRINPYVLPNSFYAFLKPVN